MRPSQMPGSIITPPLIPTHVKAFQDSRSSKVPANYQAVSSSKTTSDSDIVICGTQAAAGRQFVGVLLDNPEFNTLDRYQSIACEKRYIDASFEELRLLDYTNQLRFAGNLTKEVSAQALSNPSSFGKYVHSGYRKMSSSPKRPVAETGVEQGMVPEGMIQRSSANTALDPSAELEYYFNVLGVGQVARSKSSWEEEIKTTPLFKWLVHRPSTITAAPIDPGPSTLTPPPTPSSPATAPVASPPRFEQYSVFGHELRSAGRPQLLHEEIPIFLNTNAPWSAFLCGSQGSGKSYTLSCILESCLMQSSSLGRTSSPMAGIVFAYDPHASNMACEAASLASHLPVNVLVSPSNYLDMKQMYEKLGCKGRINVQPLFLNQSNLNTKRILKLMAFGGGDGPTPLYMEVLINILKEMRIGKSEAVHGFDYALFLAKIRDQKFDAMQKGPMNLRLSLLDSFMDTGSFAAKLPANKSKNLFEAKPGSLTIVDLSDPFVDPPSACVLFDICLALFLENRSAVGKLIALDEAHKVTHFSPVPIRPLPQSGPLLTHVLILCTVHGRNHRDRRTNRQPLHRDPRATPPWRPRRNRHPGTHRQPQTARPLLDDLRAPFHLPRMAYHAVETSGWCIAVPV